MDFQISFDRRTFVSPIQAVMNPSNSTSPAPDTNAQRDDNVEWRELRKKLLEQIVRSDAARKERPRTTSNTNNPHLS